MLLKMGAKEALKTSHEAWLAQVGAWKEEYALRYNKQPDGTLPPQQVLAELNDLLKGDAHYCY